MSNFRDRVAAQRQAIAESRASGERAYKFAVGKTIIRILPGLKDPDDFAKTYGAHYIKDPATKSIVAVVGDSEICYGPSRPCSVRRKIGEFVAQQSAIGDQETAKFAKDWLAKEQYVTNTEIIGGVDVENKGKVVRNEWSKNQYDGILSAIDTVFMGNPDFNMKDGLCLVVERTGTGQTDTRYTFQVLPGNPPPPSAAILAARMDLDVYVDSKFGKSVEQALAKLSAFMGEEAANELIHGSVETTPKLTNGSTAGNSGASNSGTFDYDAAVTGVVDTAQDAVFSDVVSGADAGGEQSFDDILAGLEGLTA